MTVSSHGAQAQARVGVLRGRITDAESGAPLNGASVSVDAEKSGVVSTDAQGNYQVAVAPGEHSIKITYLGYLPFRQRITMTADNRELNATLASIANQLAEVIVSARETDKKVANTAIGVDYLNIQGIRKMPTMLGEVDLLRSIQTLPGVTSVGEGANGVNIRGGNVDQNLILVDDMPIFNPTHMFGLFSVLSTESIRSVELYKGGIPAAFGGRTSAIMDIKMVKPDLDQFKLSGGIGLISNRLAIETPIIKQKLSVMASGRLSYNDFLLKLLSNPTLKGTSANFYDLAGKVFYRPDAKNVLSFSTYFSNDNYTVDSLFALANVVARQTRFTYQHANAALHWDHSFRENLNLNVTAVSSQYTTRTTAPDSATRIDLATQLDYKNLRVSLDYAPVKAHQLTFGLSGIRYDNRPGTLNQGIASAVLPVVLPREQAYELAAYVADVWEVSPRLKLEAGLRYAHFLNLGAATVNSYAPGLPWSPETVTGTREVGGGAVESSYGGLEPRLAARYTLSESSSIKLGYNRMQQFIQLIANNTTPLPTARWRTANTNIRPQVSDFASLGYFQELSERWEFSLEGYYRRTDRVLDYTSGANLQLNPTLETNLLPGRARAYGAEFLLSKKRGELTGWLSYTYSRALQQIPGVVPEQALNQGRWFAANYDRPHALNLLLNIEPNPTHIFSFTFSYATGRPYSAPTGFYRSGNGQILIYDERNNARVSDYHRLDFAWTIRNPTMTARRWTGSWVFAVYNLYGRQNAYSYFFRTDLTPYKLSIFASPFLSLTYNFIFK